MGVLVGTGLCALVGCGGSGGDDPQSGDGALSAGGSSKAPATTPAATIGLGNYVLDTQDVSATLNVIGASASSISYTFTVFETTGGPGPFASLHGRTANKSASAVFNDVFDSVCQVSLQAAPGGTIEVTVTGDCSHHGLAAFSHGSGAYVNGDAHDCDLGTTFDPHSARCAGSGGQNDPADNQGCAPGTTFDPGSARCAGSGGQNDPLDEG
jgi:hypothetical protein